MMFRKWQINKEHLNPYHEVQLLRETFVSQSLGADKVGYKICSLFCAAARNRLIKAFGLEENRKVAGHKTTGLEISLVKKKKAPELQTVGL